MRLRSSGLRWLLGAGLLCLLVGFQARKSGLQRYEYTQYHMGVYVRLVVYASEEAKAERACSAAFDRFAELDNILSDYKADSELMKLCAHAGGPPVKVSKDLFLVLQRSQEVAERSEGAFDITCGPLIALWRKARKTHVLPTSEELEVVRALVGWRKVRLDAKQRTVQLLTAGMKLDLGGIGKGYADDCAQQVLKQHGITRALVEAGGDIVVSGPPPGRDGWRIEVPDAGTADKTPTLTFANQAISTSGDTVQFTEIGGKHYSHIVDPRTGEALTDRIAVTIVARDGLTSDSLSTAMSVLGAEKGEVLMKTYPGTKAYIRFLAAPGK